VSILHHSPLSIHGLKWSSLEAAGVALWVIVDPLEPFVTIGDRSQVAGGIATLLHMLSAVFWMDRLLHFVERDRPFHVVKAFFVGSLGNEFLKAINSACFPRLKSVGWLLLGSLPIAVSVRKPRLLLPFGRVHLNGMCNELARHTTFWCMILLKYVD
jgi:hypothetical protein